MGDRNKTTNQTNSDGGDNVAGDKFSGDKHEYHFHPEQPAVEVGVSNNLGEFRSKFLPKFVGRKDALEQLDRIVGTADVVAVTAAVAGMGGIGKTELVWQWANHQWKNDKFPGGVCWVDCAAGEPGDRIIRFCQMAFKAEIPETLTTIAERVQFCWNQWQRWQTGAVLLVLDDVARDRFREEISPILPPTDSVRVVMTTRDRYWSKPIQTVPLDELLPDEARILLAEHVGEARLAAEPEAVQGVLNWMDGLPLGLELAGRFLAEDEFLSVADYLAELEQERFTHESIDEPSPEMRYPVGIWKAILVTWRKLTAEERSLAMRLGIYGPAPIPLTEEQAKDWCKELRRLVNLSLVKRSQRFLVSLHPLVRQFLREQLDTVPEREEVRRSVAALVTAKGMEISWPLSTQKMQGFAPWIPHLQVVAKELLDTVSDAWVIEPSTRLAYFYEGQGLYSAALLWKQQTVNVARQRLGSSQPSLAIALNDLAVAYRAQGEYDQAISVLKESLAVKRISLSPHDPSLATTLNNLAISYKSQREYEIAEDLYKEAIKIDRKSLPANHPT